MAEEAEGTPYQALYRRFRPQRFADVLGQEHVTRALRAAVRDAKVAHAYLFSGPRGTGKTSTARILAMALNCENPEDGEPCGRCESCLAVRQGTSLDVQELDSATNRGIDEMRDLLSRVALGTPGRWKVYIVDEVHQMTSAAASALLKTLEEPPGHVVFVLATTDPQKVLQTIRSRTQHFEFRLLGSEVLSSLLTDVARRADIDLPADAIDLVVRRGHGSARDALSALDQVAASGTVEDDATIVPGLVQALIDQDAAGALVKVAEGTQAGLDARRLGTELLQYLRNGFLATRAPALVLLTEAESAEVETQARKLGAAALVRAMDLIGQALIDMRDSADARTTLEVALVRLAAPEVDDSKAALLERIERLERAVASGTGAGGGAGTAGAGAPAGAVAPVGAAAPAGAVAPAGAAAPGGAVAPARSEGPVERDGGASGGGASGGGASGGGASGGGAPGGGASRVGPRAAGTPRSGAPAGAPAPGRSSSFGPPPPLPGQSRPSAARPAAPPADPSRVPPAGPERPVSSAPPAGPARAAAGEPGTGGGVPSREELTMAWGDRILPSLRPAVKVYVATGRFLPSEPGAAVYAVADRGLLSRAEPGRAEVEAALAAHFGRRVPLKLVLDDQPGPADAGAQPDPAPAPEEDPAAYEWAEMEEAPAAVVSPEQRLLDAFPGAEEVDP